MGLLRRQSAHKLIVNVGLLERWRRATACLIFFTFIGDLSPVTPEGWIVIYASTLGAYLVSALLVTLAITVFSGFPGRRMLTQVLARRGPGGHREHDSRHRGCGIPLGWILPRACS